MGCHPKKYLKVLINSLSRYVYRKYKTKSCHYLFKVLKFPEMRNLRNCAL